MSQAGYVSDQEARSLIVEYGREVEAKGFIVANEGNLSLRVSPTEVWITPSGARKGKMREDMLIKVDLDGTLLAGDRKPSSETRMHLRVHRENPEVRAVVHCHPLYATSLGIAGIPLDAPLLAEPMLMLGPVPVAKYCTPGSAELADSIAPFCRDYNAALMSNHGAIVWGRDMTEAFYRMEVLETYAKFILISRFLGQARPLSQEQMDALYAFKVAGGFGDVKLPRGAAQTTNRTDVLPDRD